MNIFELVQWIKALINYNNIKAFYNSTVWQHVRSVALKRDNYECQKCKIRGKYTKAVCNHHKKHVKEYPELWIT